jgi:hypothetical protein
MRTSKLSAILLPCVLGLCPAGSADTPSSISANFNGTAIGSGDSIWFSSVMKPSGLGTKAVTIFVRNSTITFSANGTLYAVPVPDANVTFNPSATSATTTFNTAQNLWQTIVPSSGLAGNILLDAAKFPVPSGGLPGGIQNVTWKANFSTDTAGISLQWQWGAALYTSFSADYNAVGVKPVDDNKASQYQNSDAAGTPENWKGYVTGGTTGGGGSNYTGGLSGTASATVAVNQIPTANPGGPYSGVAGQAISFNGAGSSDADGDPLSYSWSFGDGGTASGVSPSYTYMSSGTFAVTLTVNDGRNDTGTASTTASIALPAPPPAPKITAQISPSPNSKGWNNTPATVTFTCSSSSSTIATCTSPITVSAQGASQVATGTATDKAGNSTTINVSLNIDLTPPTISASASPLADGAGWTNSAVTVNFQCSDSLSGVALCPGPQTVSTEGANQTIPGTATDVAGNTASTSISLNIDLTPPVIAVTSPSDGSVVTNSNLNVTGTASDALSGIADVACNGVDATITGSNTSCNLTLSVGTNAIQVQAFDLAGNTATTTINVTYNLSPPPTALFLTPDHLAMALSESRKVALVDNLARAIPASSWTVSDPTVAQVAPDGTITPLAAGNVTITATYQSLSATAQLTVYGSQTFPPDTARWTVQPLPGNTLMEVFPGQASGPDDPDVYFAEQAGSNIVMRALTSDGRQIWTHTIVPALGTTPVNTLGSGSSQLRNTGAKATGFGTIRPHRWGKRITKLLNESGGANKPPVTSAMYGTPLRPAVFKPAASTFLRDAPQRKGHLKRVQAGSSVRQIVLASATTDLGNEVVNTFERGSGGCATNCQDDIRVLDGNGNELWRHSILGGEMGFAVHPSGIVYILQADYNNNSTFTLFAFDELTGAQKFSIVLPFSFGGQLQPFPGLPSVLPDGNLYLPVETVADSNSPDVLQLLKVAPDGTYSWYPVFSTPPCNGPIIEAHEPLPDGQGNLLLTWDYFGNTGFCHLNPTVQAVRMSTSGQILGKYPLPLARQRLGSYFSDNDGDALLGAQHLFVVDDRGQSTVGLNLGTSTIDLSWQAAPCSGFPCPLISLAGISPNDQLILDQTGNSDGSSTLLAVTPNSNSCPTTCISTSSVPNSTLMTFDFSGTVFSPAVGTSVSANQYFSVLPDPSGASGTGSVGGAVTGPDASTLPEPDSLPAWPQVAMNDSRKASLISIKLNFKKGSKTSGDLLSFTSLTPEGIVDCTESLGPQDCSGPPADFNKADRWLLNFEGNGRVYDDASNWTVAQSIGPIHTSGFYINIDNNLTAFSCTAPAKSDDGPLQSRVQQPAAQKSIFYIDGPGTSTHVANKSGCAVGFSPIDSMTWWANFKVKFSNQSVNYSKTVYFYVKLSVNTDRQMDYTNSLGKTGSLP